MSTWWKKKRCILCIQTFLLLVWSTTGYSGSNFFARNLMIPPLPLTNDLKTDELPVVYTNAPNYIEEWFQTHLVSQDGGPIVVGFDVESVPNAPWIRRSFDGPATVQIAVENASLVIHLVGKDGHPTKAAAPVLRKFLQDDSIVKAGIGIEDDMLELYRWFGDPKGDICSRFDISGVGAENPGQRVALHRLASQVVGVTLKKSKKISASNWGKMPLRENQISYAARDAWAAAAIMAKLHTEDPGCFSPSAIRSLIQGEEVPIAASNKRAIARKVARMRFLEICEHRNKIPRELDEKSRAEAEELQQEIRALAPPPPFFFNLRSDDTT